MIFVVLFSRRQVEVTNDERDPRHHYLKGLEGCSAELLAGVQSAFEDLYGLLRTLLDHSLRTGQVMKNVAEFIPRALSERCVSARKRRAVVVTE